MSQINMTKDERESFLAGVHVGVLSIPKQGAPLSARHRPSGLRQAAHHRAA